MLECKKAFYLPSKAPLANEACATAFIATPTSIVLFTKTGRKAPGFGHGGISPS